MCVVRLKSSNLVIIPITLSVYTTILNPPKMMWFYIILLLICPLTHKNSMWFKAYALAISQYHLYPVHNLLR